MELVHRLTLLVLNSRQNSLYVKKIQAFTLSINLNSCQPVSNRTASYWTRTTRFYDYGFISNHFEALNFKASPDLDSSLHDSSLESLDFSLEEFRLKEFARHGDKVNS